MEDRWLIALMLGPLLSPAGMALEAYNLYCYLLGADAREFVGGDDFDSVDLTPTVELATSTGRR